MQSSTRSSVTIVVVVVVVIIIIIYKYTSVVGYSYNMSYCRAQWYLFSVYSVSRPQSVSASIFIRLYSDILAGGEDAVERFHDVFCFSLMSLTWWLASQLLAIH